MSDDLRRIERWLNINKLKLNVKKTKSMLVNKKNGSIDDVQLTMNGETLEKVECIKYLGVMIDCKLNLNDNINYVCKKVAKKIGCMGRVSKNLTPSARLNVYRSIIAPHFEFCSSLLFAANKGQMDKMQKLQNRALRVILRCSRDTSIHVMLGKLQLMSVKQRIFVGTMKMIFKIKHGLVPEYLSGEVKINNQCNKFNLRNGHDFKLPRCRTSKTQHMLFYNGLKSFNKLPKEIKFESDFTAFKNKLNKFAIDN